MKEKGRDGNPDSRSMKGFTVSRQDSSHTRNAGTGLMSKGGADVAAGPRMTPVNGDFR